MHANIPTATGLPARSNKESLQKQLLERLERLNEMREVWHMNCSSLMWPVPVVSALSQDSDNIRPPFDTSLYFADMFRAYSYCAFNMTLILLFLLYQDLSPDNIQPIEDILPGCWPDGSTQTLVRNICRCTEFLCLEKHGSRGFIVLQLPATIAYLATDKNSPEAQWLYNVCKKRARGSGFGFGDFAMDQVTPLSQWLASCRDRRRNLGSNGPFSVVRPCWAPDPEERAVGSTSLQSDTILPMRARRSSGGGILKV